MSTAVSPLAPTDVPEMPAIAGVKLATAAAGIPSLDQVFASLISTVTGLFWQTLAYLYYLGFLLLIPIYAALALWLPVAYIGSILGLT